jgi:hypothetical protein
MNVVERKKENARRKPLTLLHKNMWRGGCVWSREYRRSPIDTSNCNVESEAISGCTGRSPALPAGSTENSGRLRDGRNGYEQELGAGCYHQ